GATRIAVPRAPEQTARAGIFTATANPATMQQRVHRALLQVFRHLPAVTTRRGSSIGVAMAAALIACACALAAALLTCVAALAAHTTRASEDAHGAAAGSSCPGERLLPSAANVRAVDTATLC